MFRLYQTCQKRQEGGFADGRAAETKGAVLTKSSEVFPGMFEQTPEKDANISDRITYHLHRTKTSHWKLAKALGCSRDTIFSYANGKISEDRMDIVVLKKMAEYFGMEAYYFCNEYHIFVDTADVPEYLKGIRRAKGMSQKKFCEAFQIPLTAYKKYETGAVRIPGKYYRVVVGVE